MKRCLALGLSIVMVLVMMLSFASCDSGMVNGYYVITNITIDGESYPAGDPLNTIQKSVDGISNFYVKLIGNGEGELCCGGEISPLTYDDTQMKVDGASYPYTYANGVITLNDFTVQRGPKDAKEEVVSVIELTYSADADGNV